MIGLARLVTAAPRLIVGVLVAQVGAILALRAMHAPALWPKASRMRRAARRIAQGSEDRVAWAIEATGRRLPGLSTCLVRAIAAEALLGSDERPVHVRIGVKRGPHGAVEGHAWAEREGHVLVGGPLSGRFVSLVTLNE